MLSVVLLQAAFGDAEMASTAMQAVAPVGVTLLKNETMTIQSSA